MANLKDLTKALRVETGKELTLEQVQDARKIYVEIAEKTVETKDYAEWQFAVAKMNQAFLKLLDQDWTKAENIRKAVFIENANKMNAQISEKVGENEYKVLLSVVFRDTDKVMDLVKQHDFQLI